MGFDADFSLLVYQMIRRTDNTVPLLPDFLADFPDSLKVFIGIVFIRLQIRAFTPFIPGVDKNEPVVLLADTFLYQSP